MEGDIEVFVVNPDWCGQVGKAEDSLPITRRVGDPVSHMLNERLIGEGSFTWLEDLQGGVVHGRLSRVRIQDPHVCWAQAFDHLSHPFRIATCRRVRF